LWSWRLARVSYASAGHQKEVLHDAAQFYWGTIDAWSGEKRVFGPDSTVIRLPSSRVQDIDSEEDWIRAEAMYAALEQ
jgi:N-acylneuraminate cytidylyltransferase